MPLNASLSFIIGGEGPASHDPSEWNAHIRGLGAENMAYMVEDGAREHSVWHPGIHAAYAANDLDATLLACEELHVNDFSSDVPGMKTPILLLAGSEDTQWTGIAEASQQLPNATLADLPGLDHAQGFWLIDEVLPEITGVPGRSERRRRGTGSRVGQRNSGRDRSPGRGHDD